MTGFDLAREIKNERPDVPILLCTGFFEKADSGKVEGVSIEAVLTKPLEKSRLAQTVRNLLDRTGAR
jgi:CheY-like chemotaxis protein